MCFVVIIIPYSRNQRPYLKKYVKPSRVCSSNVGTIPKLRLSVSSSSQRPIVPLLGTLLCNRILNLVFKTPHK